jgi:hypothetical protein
MPTLAELRAQTGPKPLPKATRTVTLVEGQHLLARSQELQEKHIDRLMAIERDREASKDDGRQRTRKAGEKLAATDDPQLAEIKAEMRAISDQLAEFQAEIGLEGMTGGEWQRYKDAHPPREDDKSDERLTSDLCNSSDLFGDLGRFVVSWEGEDLSETDWDGWLAERICYADRRDLVTAVVEIHEARLPRSPKSQSGASLTEVSATA